MKTSTDRPGDPVAVAPRPGAVVSGDRERSRGTAVSEEQTRRAVARLVLERGPVPASDVAAVLGIGPAGVRRHLDALSAAGEATCASAPSRGPRRRGRPARSWVLTPAGRTRFGHAYDDLAVDALRHLRELAGDTAVLELARRRARAVTASVRADAPRHDVAADLAEALTSAGYAASTRDVGSGVQLCQHHCPVAHVASEFPQLCEAEREAFAELLGTPVQRLATIANGDPVCTTHVPLAGGAPGGPGTPGAPPRSTSRAPGTSPTRTIRPRTTLRKEIA